MTKKVFSLLYFILLNTCLLFGYYEKNYPILLDQPDGTKIQCYITGDEFYRRLHDENGYTVIRDKFTGYLVYASIENDVLIPTAYVINSVDPQSVGLKPDIDISNDKIEQLRKNFLSITPKKKDLPGYKSANSSKGGWNNGTLNNIIIYIRFADQEEFEMNALVYEDQFNKDEDGFSSMYRYFKELSYDQTFIRSTFYPLRTDTLIISYQDIYPRSYYLPYDAVRNPEGYDADNYYEQAEREHSLLERAIVAVQNQIPSTLDLDFNNDGYVDNICFIVRGETTAWNSLLWPHKWSLYSKNVTINGSMVWTYNFQIENHLNQAATSVLCHEMFHSLGAPDLYRYNETSATPVGPWDLMAQNTSPPQSTSIYMKYKYGGWVNNIPEITENGSYTINNVWSETNNCYKISSPNSSGSNQEFFLVEYRDVSVFWDNGLPGSGLIMYRINPDYDGNADGPPDEVDIFRPTSGLNFANFNHEHNRTIFSETTNPPCVLSDNTPGGIMIYNISRSDTTMSFDILIGPGIAFSPSLIDFGETSILEVSDLKTIRVSPFNISGNFDYEIIGNDPGAFDVIENSWDTLNGGTLDILFHPDQVRNYHALLKITSADENYTMALSGEGVVVPVEANFTSNTFQIFSGNEIHFFDESTGTPSSWTWTFEGGEPNISHDRNPIVGYNNPGIYSVKLNAQNQFGSDEKVIDMFIRVDPLSENIICNESFEYWYNNKPNCWFGNKTSFRPTILLACYDNPYDGEISCQLINSFQSSMRFTSKPVNVIENKTYMIEFYVKGSGEISTALFDNRNENSGYSPSNEFISVNSQEWTKYTHTVTAVRNYNEGEFVFLVRNTRVYNSHIIIDKVSIKEVNHSSVHDKSHESDIAIYPNPSDGVFFVISDKNISVEVFSITGNLISKHKSDGNLTIDISDFPSGMYLIKVTDQDNINKTQKIIKQ